MIKFPGKIPIHIDPLFWVLCFGIGWLNSGTVPLTLIWGVVILCSVLFHEFGHALTAMAFGQSVSITLMMLGGLTKREGPRLAKWKDFLIVLNGPLAGFLLAFTALWCLPYFSANKHPYIHDALLIAAYVNFFWTVINLFPIQPLDGGHLLMIMLQGLFGYTGIKIAYFLSMILAALLAFVAFYYQQVLMGALFFLFAFESFRSFQSAQNMTQEDQDEGLQDNLREADQLYNSGKRQEAKELLEKDILAKSSTKGLIYAKASELLAKILNEEGMPDKAFAQLNSQKKNLDLDGLMLLQTVAYKSNHLREALELGAQIHREYANSDTALINALSHAALNEEKPAVGWLQTAINEGLQNPYLIMQNVRFDPIRNTAAFKELSNKVKNNSA